MSEEKPQDEIQTKEMLKISSSLESSTIVKVETSVVESSTVVEESSTAMKESSTVVEESSTTMTESAVIQQSSSVLTKLESSTKRQELLSDISVTANTMLSEFLESTTLISESDLKLEERLNLIQKQLLILSKLPISIEASLSAVKTQLLKMLKTDDAGQQIANSIVEQSLLVKDSVPKPVPEEEDLAPPEIDSELIAEIHLIAHKMMEQFIEVSIKSSDTDDAMRDQLAKVQKQLAALSKLPAAIDSTIQSIGTELAKIETSPNNIEEETQKRQKLLSDISITASGMLKQFLDSTKKIWDSGMSTENQLRQVRKQLVALSKLPGTIQTSLNSVKSQLETVLKKTNGSSSAVEVVKAI